MSDALNQLRDMLKETIPIIIGNYNIPEDLQWEIIRSVHPNPQSFQQLFSSSIIRLEYKYPNSLQQIKEINNQIRNFYKENSLKVQDIIKYEKDIRENVIQFNNLKNESQTQIKTTEYRLQNITCNDCFCQKGKLSLGTINCRMCTKTYHMECLGMTKFHKNYCCPRCVLFYLDPFNPVQQVVYQPVKFSPTTNINNHNFQLNYDPSKLLEIRCIRMDENHGYEELSWPDQGELFINSKSYKIFQPLALNSSLKKRKEEKILLHKAPSMPLSVSLKECIPHYKDRIEFKILYEQQYFIGCYSVYSLNSQQLCQSIITDQSSLLSIESSKELIQYWFNQFGKNDDLSVQEIKVSLQDVLDYTIINTPVRGIFCEHIQCFSLENYLMLSEKSSSRRFRCPLCKQKLFKFQIDGYQYSIIQQIKSQGLNMTEIQFDCHGEIIGNFKLDYDKLPVQLQRNSNKLFQVQPTKAIQIEKKTLQKKEQICKKSIDTITID